MPTFDASKLGFDDSPTNPIWTGSSMGKVMKRGPQPVVGDSVLLLHESVYISVGITDQQGLSYSGRIEFFEFSETEDYLGMFEGNEISFEFKHIRGSREGE